MKYSRLHNDREYGTTIYKLLIDNRLVAQMEVRNDLLVEGEDVIYRCLDKLAEVKEPPYYANRKGARKNEKR